MADQIVSWGGFNSKGTSGMGVTGSISVVGSGSFGYSSIANGNTYIKIDPNQYNSKITFNDFDGGINTRGGELEMSTYYSRLTYGSYNWFYIGNSSYPYLFFIGDNRRILISDASSKPTNATAMLQVKGTGTTSSTTALLVQNANASASFQVKDNSEVVFATPDYSPADGGNPFAYLSKTRTGIYVANTANNFGISYEGGQIYANIGYSTGNPTFTPSNGVWTTNSRINAPSLRGTNGIFVSGLDKFVAAEGGTDLNIILGGSTSASGQGRIIAYGEAHSPKQGKLELYSGTDPVYGVISFSPGNTEAARFTPDGRLNIGAITGSAKLLLSGSSNSGLLQVSSPASSNILYVSGSGNVGIGLNNPQGATHIAVASGTPALVLSDVGSPNTIPTLQFRRGPLSAFSLQVDFPSNNKARFQIGDAVTGYELTGGNLGLTGGNSIEFAGITGQVATAIVGSIHTDNNNGQLLFSTRGSAVTAERARITNNGNFLVGTTTDSARLGVKGSGTTSSTTALLVQNANASNMLSLTDNGALTLNAFQTSSTSITINRTLGTMGSNFNLATMGSLVNLTDTVGNSNTSKTTLYINTTGASQNNALIIENGYIGFGTTSPGSGFVSAYFTTLYGLRVNYASDYQITSRDYTSRFNTSSGGGISFWGDASGQATGQSAFAGIRGLKANNTYVNPLGNLAFYVQTGSSSHVITETTFKEVGRFNESGNFGINTSSPTEKLYVAGSTIITGSLTVGLTTSGSSENTLTVGPPMGGGTGEGGQILLAASGGLYTSASMFDNYQNSFRLLRGTNTGSDGFKLKVDLHSGQVQIPNYNSPTAFTGASVANLAVDNTGNILTAAGYTGTVTIMGNPPGQQNLDFQNGILVNVF